jgi:hypothetical protein
MQADASDYDVYSHRGQYHLLVNDPRAAVRDLQKACTKEDAPPVAHASWGVALFKVHDMNHSTIIYAILYCSTAY